MIRCYQLDATGILGLDHFPAKDSDVEVLRFFLVPHGEKVRRESLRVQSAHQADFMRDLRC
jgi:hypothetical protein